MKTIETIHFIINLSPENLVTFPEIQVLADSAKFITFAP